MIKGKTLVIIISILIFYTLFTIIAYRNIKRNVLISEKQEDDYRYVGESQHENFQR